MSWRSQNQTGYIKITSSYTLQNNFYGLSEATNKHCSIASKLSMQETVLVLFIREFICSQELYFFNNTGWRAA